MTHPASTTLKKTPLTDWHRAHGGRMVEFVGWDMPVEYSGLSQEHVAVRTRAGLFDVTHMGQIEIAGKDALAAVEIKSFQIYSVSYDRSGIALEYQTTVIIDLTLKKKTGEILWVEKDLSDSRVYRTSTNILASESNKAAAIQLLSRFMAERIRNRFFYNF